MYFRPTAHYGRRRLERVGRGRANPIGRARYTCFHTWSTQSFTIPLTSLLEGLITIIGVGKRARPPPTPRPLGTGSRCTFARLILRHSTPTRSLPQRTTRRTAARTPGTPWAPIFSGK